MILNYDQFNNGYFKSYDEREEKKALEDKVMLFGTKTCPNCKMAKSLLEKANISFEFVDAEENVELTKSLNVKQAPTLVVIKNNEQQNIVNLSNIKKWVSEQ